LRGNLVPLIKVLKEGFEGNLGSPTGSRTKMTTKLATSLNYANKT